MATIQDIADEVGISKAAVSRILNKKGSFSAETINKVMNVARRMNYVSPAMLRQEDPYEARTIMAVLPTESHPYYGTLAMLMEQAAYRYGYGFMLCTSGFDREKEEACLRLLREKRVDGLLLASFTADYTAPELRQLPILCLGYQAAEALPVVCSDNYSAGKIAARHLLSKGCRTMLYLSDFVDGLTYDERYKGFSEELASHDAEVFAYHLPVGAHIDNEIAGMATQMALEHPQVDAIFAESQTIAIECLNVYSALGYRVPQDIKILGYGNSALMRYCCPRFSYVRENTRLIAQNAISTLVEMIENGPGTLQDRVIRVPVSVEQNQTT